MVMGCNRTDTYRILSVYISMLIKEAFSLIQLYGKHIVYSDGDAWHPVACGALGLKHRLHSTFQKSR